jgi:hypothetical protein
VSPFCFLIAGMFNTGWCLAKMKTSASMKMLAEQMGGGGMSKGAGAVGEPKNKYKQRIVSQKALQQQGVCCMQRDSSNNTSFCCSSKRAAPACLSSRGQRIPHTCTTITSVCSPVSHIRLLCRHDRLPCQPIVHPPTQLAIVLRMPQHRPTRLCLSRRNTLNRAPALHSRSTPAAHRVYRVPVQISVSTEYWGSV